VDPGTTCLPILNQFITSAFYNPGLRSQSLAGEKSSKQPRGFYPTKILHKSKNLSYTSAYSIKTFQETYPNSKENPDEHFHNILKPSVNSWYGR